MAQPVRHLEVWIRGEQENCIGWLGLGGQVTFHFEIIFKDKNSQVSFIHVLKYCDIFWLPWEWQRLSLTQVLIRLLSAVSLTLLLFSCSVVSASLWPHGLQHTRLPYPSPSPRACSNSHPLSWWCHPTSLTSVIPFFSCLQFTSWILPSIHFLNPVISISKHLSHHLP